MLIIGIFISLGLTYYFIKKQKQEKQEQPASTGAAVGAATDRRQSTRRRLVLMMVLGSAVGLSSPFWMPLTGTTLGPPGDFACGILTAVVVCTMCGLRLRRI